jgi:8-oxo-dGTP pyrophosphatase MutT (NUDIX family)
MITSENPSEPQPAARAATILLVRDHPSFEVLMVKRHEKMAFAAGALVFPGGKIDPQDDDPKWMDHTTGWNDITADHRALRIGALRELFEETGVLLSAVRQDGMSWNASTDVTRARAALCAGETTFLSTVREAGATLDLAGMELFAHWITPESMPKRFDTFFFVAGAGTAQEAVSDGRETVDVEWIAPQEALRLGAAKQRILAFPTRLNLKLLADNHSVDQALATTRARKVVTVRSRIEQREAGRVLTIAADAGYGVVEEPVSELIGRGHRIAPDW